MYQHRSVEASPLIYTLFYCGRCVTSHLHPVLLWKMRHLSFTPHFIVEDASPLIYTLFYCGRCVTSHLHPILLWNMRHLSFTPHFIVEDASPLIYTPFYCGSRTKVVWCCAIFAILQQWYWEAGPFQVWCWVTELVFTNTEEFHAFETLGNNSWASNVTSL